MALVAKPFSAVRPVASRPRAGRVPLRVNASVTVERASLDISKMSPIHDRVLIKPLEEEAKSAGGILLPRGPPKANSDAHIGEVISMGSEVKLGLKAGDFVVYQKYAMAEVEVQEGNILFLSEKSILATLDQ